MFSQDWCCPIITSNWWVTCFMLVTFAIVLSLTLLQCGLCDDAANGQSDSKTGVLKGNKSKLNQPPKLGSAKPQSKVKSCSSLNRSVAPLAASKVRSKQQSKASGQAMAQFPAGAESQDDSEKSNSDKDTDGKDVFGALLKIKVKSVSHYMGPKAPA